MLCLVTSLVIPTLLFGQGYAAPASSRAPSFIHFSALKARNPQRWDPPVSGIGLNVAKPPINTPVGSTAFQPAVAANPLPASSQLKPGIVIPWASSSPAQSITSPQPAKSAAPTDKLAFLAATTRNETAFCRKWPDTISTESSRLRIIAPSSKIDVNCWTSGSIDGDYGKWQGDAIWFKTRDGCYVSRKDLANSEDYQTQLKACMDLKNHWVGVLQAQYKREDCYQCLSPNCASQNLGQGPYLDIDCFASGEVVAGNSTWFKQVDQACYYPGAIFAIAGWLGKAQKCT